MTLLIQDFFMLGPKLEEMTTSNEYLVVKTKALCCGKEVKPPTSLRKTQHVVLYLQSNFKFFSNDMSPNVGLVDYAYTCCRCPWGCLVPLCAFKALSLVFFGPRGLKHVLAVK